MQAAYEENKDDVRHLNTGKFDVKEIMETWLTQKHYPVMNVSQNDTFITITTQSKLNTSEKNENEKKWWIPYTAAIMEASFNSSLSNLSMQYLLADKNEITYTKENYKWIIVNLQQMGK